MHRCWSRESGGWAIHVPHSGTLSLCFNRRQTQAVGYQRRIVNCEGNSCLAPIIRKRGGEITYDAWAAQEFSATTISGRMAIASAPPNRSSPKSNDLVKLFPGHNTNPRCCARRRSANTAARVPPGADRTTTNRTSSSRAPAASRGPWFHGPRSARRTRRIRRSRRACQ